jgi:hypothetical protein
MMAPLLVIVSFEPGSLQQKTFIGDLHNPQKPGQTGSSCLRMGFNGMQEIFGGSLCFSSENLQRIWQEAAAQLQKASVNRLAWAG